MAPPVGIVIGHSFVHGLLKHLTQDSSPSPTNIAHRLRLSQILAGLHLYGERGARVCSRSYHLPHRLLQTVKPDFVILDLGTNDIALGAAPFDVASKIISLAETLRTRYFVNHIMVCSLIERNRHLFAMSPQQFSTAAYEVNNYLKHFAHADPHITYHGHKGFWSQDISFWSRDGVHPNSTTGRDCYKKSIGRAVFRALEPFTTSA